MPGPLNTKWWSRFFLAAAIFNYAIGLPIIGARKWSYALAYAPSADHGAMAVRLWADFGIFVVLIGFGYQIVSRDVTQNRGVVLLGILAKLFDVINLSVLYGLGIAKAVVLIPALCDAVFTAFFLVFWWGTREGAKQRSSG